MFSKTRLIVVSICLIFVFSNTIFAAGPALDYGKAQEFAKACAE